MFDLKSDTQKQPASALHIYNWQIHFSFEHVDSESEQTDVHLYNKMNGMSAD
jgi:hypothetical protein